MKIIQSVITLIIVFTFITCTNEHAPEADKLRFTAASDSTIYYYRLGWTQIMDYGQYTEAEHSYRRALMFDADFLTGKSVLARLTTNQEERKELLQQIYENRHTITGDERLVLDVYTALTEFTIARDDDDPEAPNLLNNTLELAERNLRKIVNRYPGEVHIKAEFIEVLNYRHGPKAALDSLAAHIPGNRIENPFLLGYAAGMHASLGNFETALKKAAQLDSTLTNPEWPKTHAVYADIYLKMDDPATACPYAEKAYALDQNNVDVQRLIAQCD